MKFKYVYKCQRCGVLFERKTINEYDNDFSFDKESYYYGHVCGVNERGIGHPVGFNVIDEEVKAPFDSGSLLRKQLDHLEFQMEFLKQIESVRENANDNPYWIIICGKDDEVLGVIGDSNGLSLDTSKECVIRFIDLPLECVIERSGMVSKISLSPVSGRGPRLDMKAGTYEQYEWQVNEFNFSDIVARLESVEVQAGRPFRVDTARIC